MSKKLPKLIVVLGPTASGKTALSLGLAKKFNGEIVGADSRQVYRGMDIGTAKELNQSKVEGEYLVEEVPHYLIDYLYPDEEFNIALYQRKAFPKINEIIGRGCLPFLVGGSSLYISAIVDNYEIPDKKGEPLYDVLMLGMKWDREKLYERINMRVDQMVDEGLFEEAGTLIKKYGMNISSMKSIGYQEVGEYLKGDLTREQAIEKIKKSTRNFAKRQLTWWRGDDRIHWVENFEQGERLVKDFMI